MLSAVETTGTLFTQLKTYSSHMVDQCINIQFVINCIRID